MILAAPLVIPFAEAVGLSVATLGMAKVADMVNEYIQENPEQSMKILSTIVPGVGIGEIFMKKGKDEEVEEDIEVEDVDARDLTRAEKAKEMKRRFKEGTGDKREIGKKGYEEIILPGKEDEMLDEAEDRYEGGVEEVSKPKFDYKKFFKKRYADGGAIGIEVLFEEKKPRKNFNEGGYEPLFTEDVETFTAPIGLNTTTVPSRISKAYTDATNEAFRIGNVAAKTGLTNPESIMKVSEMPMAIRTLSDINMMDRKNISNPYSKFEKQGLSSDYRHTLGTSAFKDSIIDYLGSNLGIDKQSGILDTIGSLAAKGATVFEEGKDALSQLKSYQNIDPYSGIQDYGVIPSGLKLSEILAQPIEDYEANVFAADQIPFGTSPLKKMEMIQAYRKFGMDNYMQQLENQKKAAMQEKIRKAEAAAKAEAARATQYGATNYGQGAGGQSYSNMGTQGFGVAAGGMGGPVSNRTGRGRTDYDDGGRVGLFMGGSPLDGQALSIYNSMNAYGFSDQEIANALQEQGLYTPGSTPDTTPDTGIISAQSNNDKGSTSIGAPSSLVSDFKTQTQNRQNRLTNPNKVQSFINKFTGGGQADIGEMIRTGQIDTRKTSGIPLGVGAIFAKMMPDKYYDMSLGDQVFTQSQMGYTGPTVFGENTSGLNKDPFGLNTRSAFGNYAEAVGEDFASLSESLSGRLADKYGVEFDEETGMFVGANAKLANQMTNMMRTKFNFRKDQLAAKNRLDAQIKAAEAERQKQIELQKKIEAEAAAGKSLSQIGRENFTGEGMAFQAGNTDQGGGVTKGKVQKSSSVPGGYYGSPRKDGGLMYAEGGLVTMFKEKR